MKRPLTRVLVKIVAAGFYRQHTGFLLSFFILVFINFFYTNVLNQTHLTREQLLQTALKLVLSSVSEPLGVVLLSGIFLLYSWKSWQYVASRLRGVDMQFLVYSSTALPWSRQVQSWVLVQLVLSLPLVLVGLYAMLIGLAYGHWLIPLLLPLYLLALVVGGALYYTRLLNDPPTTEGAPAAVGAWLRRGPKPLFSLFLYEILDKKRLPYGITKVGSLVCVALLFSVFPDAHSDLRLLGFIGLCVALTQVVLLYQASEFEKFYLQFTRNFPYSFWQIFGQQVALYGALLLPELIWFLMVGTSSQGLLGAGLLLGVTLFFRALLYWLGHQLQVYLRVVFSFFLAFLFTTLFGWTELLIVGNVVAAGVLLYRYQHQD